jgi:hypothetical protein
MQKFIFPLRYPNIVPVIVLDGINEEEFFEFWRILFDIVASWSSTMVAE